MKKRLLKKSFLLIALFTIIASTLNGRAIEKAHTDKTVQTKESSLKKQPSKKEKDWNLIVYICANNNLHRYSLHNLRQMLKVGSTDNINILVQFDEFGKREITRYYVEKHNLVHCGSESNSAIATSGTPESLYDLTKWAIEKFPAKKQALVLWNHGSGIKDPSIWGRTLLSNRDKLFSINYQTGLLQINRRSLSTQRALYEENEQRLLAELRRRGIGFNDTAEHYLTNQDLTTTLLQIKDNILGGKKIDIVMMDACHMAMVEIASQIKDCAHYMVGSEEVEPGTGYNYYYLLRPLRTQTFTAEEFARHAVASYEKEYEEENADYTQSAINLNNFDNVEKNIKKLRQQLSTLLFNYEDRSVLRVLQEIRLSGRLTTEFADTDYIDFCHFYKSLYEKLTDLLQRNTYHKAVKLCIKETQHTLMQGLNMMQNYIIKSSAGMNLPHAYGLSFYFPYRKVHSSYGKTLFDQTTQWGSFIRRFIQIS